MLKARILTALLLIPLVIAGIFLLSPVPFFIVSLLLILAAGWEWANLAGITTVSSKCFFIIILAAFLILSVLFIPPPAIVSIGLGWWLLALILILSHSKTHYWWNKGVWPRAIMGLLTLMPCWHGLLILQGFNPQLLLFCLVLIWAVDSAAYFTGRRYGQHKLAPNISPGKSYEGLLGGLVAAIGVRLIGCWLLKIQPDKRGLFLLIGTVGAGLVSVFGDLFESMVKRQAHLKDSGSLLPGHGGLLDRIDSMLTAIPFFALSFAYYFNY